jgi:hypothetical protein
MTLRGRYSAAPGISAAAALVSGACAFGIVTFIGVQIVSEEKSYDVPVLFGFPLGLVVGVLVFIVLLNKIRPKDG